jgi:hypothetical protein
MRRGYCECNWCCRQSSTQSEGGGQQAVRRKVSCWPTMAPAGSSMSGLRASADSLGFFGPSVRGKRGESTDERARRWAGQQREEAAVAGARQCSMNWSSNADCGCGQNFFFVRATRGCLFLVHGITKEPPTPPIAWSALSMPTGLAKDAGRGIRLPEPYVWGISVRPKLDARSR